MYKAKNSLMFIKNIFSLVIGLANVKPKIILLEKDVQLPPL